MSGAGYVYCIAAAGECCVKIGMTHTPASRLLSLQSATFRQLSFVGLFSSETAHKHERMVHLALRDRRVRGEWFDNSYGYAVSTFNSLLSNLPAEVFPEPVLDGAHAYRTPFDGWVKSSYGTQRRLSEATGISLIKLGRWAKGVSIPSHDDQVMLEALTGGFCAVGSWVKSENPVNYHSQKPLPPRGEMRMAP